MNLSEPGEGYLKLALDWRRSPATRSIFTKAFCTDQAAQYGERASGKGKTYHVGYQPIQVIQWRQNKCVDGKNACNHGHRHDDIFNHGLAPFLFYDPPDKSHLFHCNAIAQRH